ncbi:E3 ubiquitin-protein ligase [Apiospora saccharicola]
MSMSAAAIPHRGPPSPQRRNGTTTRAPMPTPRLNAPGLDILYRGPQVQVVDSSSEEDDDFLGTRPKPPSKPSNRHQSHSRSMSHPFPSLFSSKKKKNIGLDESTDDDYTPPDQG